MQSHQPQGYRCPFCNIAAGGEDRGTLVWEDELCLGAVALHQKPGNLGSLLLFPKEHCENVFDLPEHLGAHLFTVTKKLALKLKKALECHGITVRQNNEPAGGQDVWHYHIHIIPRFENDHFQTAAARVMQLSQRIEIAQRIQTVSSAA
jgi:histidine triad (HIT) family protein